MKSIFREAVVTVAMLAVSMPAFAGTVVTNATTTRNTTGNGYSEFSSLRNSSGMQNNYSQSLKAESLGDFADTSVSFKDGQFSGNASASTDRPVDPYSILTYSSQRETLNFTQQDIAKGNEVYSFVENSYKHDVSSDSF